MEMGKRLLRILSDVVAEAREARLWYAQRSETAAERFMHDLDRAIEQIVQTPERWPTHLHGTRRYRMNRFPFLVVYRAYPDRIDVIACQHAKRRPGYWRHRLKP